MDSAVSAPSTNVAPVSDMDTTIDVVSSGPNFDDFDRVDAVKKELKKKADKESGKEPVEKQGNKQVPEADKMKEDEAKGKSDEEKKQEETKTEEVKTEEADPENPEIEVKVNGKIEKVKLSDLKANYSGKVAYDKKFSEMDKERKQLIQDRDTFYKPMAKFKELIQDGKAGDALLHIVDFVGEDSYNFSKKLVEAMSPLVKARLEMTPEQLEAYEAKNELEHLKKKEQSAMERSKAEQANKDLNTRIAKLQETHSISDDDFRNAASKLKEQLVAAGKFKAEEFTPELVASFRNAQVQAQKAFKAIDSVNKDLGNDQKLVHELMDLINENPELSEADLVDLVKEYSGINDKLKVLTTKSQVVRNHQAPPPPARKDRPEFFSDYED